MVPRASGDPRWPQLAQGSLRVRGGRRPRDRDASLTRSAAERRELQHAHPQAGDDRQREPDDEDRRDELRTDPRTDAPAERGLPVPFGGHEATAAAASFNSSATVSTEPPVTDEKTRPIAT